MSSTAPFYFRRRTIGRAASPPTWACYEQIPYDDDDDDCSESGSESCSEDDDDYSHRSVSDPHHPQHHHDDGESDSDDDTDGGHVDPIGPHESEQEGAMVVDKEDCSDTGDQSSIEPSKKDIKGKQRAIDPPSPEPVKRQHRKKQRKTPFTLRPILTIQRSQGFVWNQDLFVPPYIKDRYVASTSPPNYGGFNSCGGFENYSEVEVVEIRVREGELNDLIP